MSNQGRSPGTTIAGRIEIRDVEGKSLSEFHEALDREISNMRRDLMDLRTRLLQVPQEEKK